MKTFLPVAAAAVLLYSAIYAQKRVLHITVVDMQGKPIESVNLTTTEYSSHGITNSDGKVTIPLATETPLNIMVELLISGPKDFVFIEPWDKRVREDRVIKIVLAEKGSSQLLEDPRALKALFSIIAQNEASLGMGREAGLVAASLQFGLPKEEIVRAIRYWGGKAKSYFDKAQADFKGKNYAQASTGFLEAYRIYKIVNAKDTNEEFDACYAYGLSLLREEKCPKAEEVFREALKLREDHSDALYSRARSLKCMGKLGEAEKLYNRTIAITEEALVEDHSNVTLKLNLSQMHNDLGDIYIKRGKYDDAEKHYRASLKINEDELRVDDSSLALSREKLADLYDVQGKRDKAETYYKKALDVFKFREEEEKDNLLRARILDSYSKMLRKINRSTEAISMEKEVVRIREKNKKRNSGN